MPSPHNTLNLSIAGFSIALASDTPFVLEEGYMPFVAAGLSTSEPDVIIDCFEGIPENQFAGAELVFEAKNSQQRFYSVYRLGSELGFVIYNQQTINTVQQTAILDESFRGWQVWSEPADGTITPLKYPLGPIIMHYMTVNTDAVLMHASCAFDGKNARIFTGFSGNGKSTISRLWADAGSVIVNDDRVVIRKSADGYKVYNTPMYYADRPKEATLSSVFVIGHSPENTMKRLTGAIAVSRVMAFSIQNNFDRQFIQNRLGFFTELCSTIPVYELGFVPDKNIIPFILKNESGGNQ